jgi:hypothetical protein
MAGAGKTFFPVSDRNCPDFCLPDQAGKISESLLARNQKTEKTLIFP